MIYNDGILQLDEPRLKLNRDGDGARGGPKTRDLKTRVSG